MRLFGNLSKRIQDDLGHPATLIEMLVQHPHAVFSLDAGPPCIALSSVPRWHELAGHVTNGGQLLGWRYENGGYNSFRTYRPQYRNIAQQETETEWVCDIGDVHGFSDSKSRLRDFASTDLMVEANSREMIDEITERKLYENLAHYEIRIIHCANTSDRFIRHLWDGRVWLSNSGGSHHFAAAKYISARLGKKIMLRGRLDTYSLSETAIASLTREFEIFAISDIDPSVINSFMDAMRAFRATWLWHRLPRPYEGVRAILLPKIEGRSMKVATELRRKGFTDLGLHLNKLAKSPLCN